MNKLFLTLISALSIMVFSLSAGAFSNKGWEPGFADYPYGAEIQYKLYSNVEFVKPPLDSKLGYLLQGLNGSDDLFMFLRKEYTGLSPDTAYDISFTITIATNAQTGCAGVGGAPGESVVVKVGSTSFKPISYLISGYYRMNLDKGGNVVNGYDMHLVGDIANGVMCNKTPQTYVIKTLADIKPKRAFSSPKGSLWAIVGFDSGFEGLTQVYVLDVQIKAQPAK